MTAANDAFIAWNSDFSLGVTEIDDQHKSLFDIINRLWLAIAMRADRDRMMSIASELERYTITHFAVEEAFMRVIGHQDLAAHKRAHAAFVKRLGIERRSLAAGKPFTLDMLHFLKEWLTSHIQVMDRAYAKEHAASRRPESFMGRLFQYFR